MQPFSLYFFYAGSLYVCDIFNFVMAMKPHICWPCLLDIISNAHLTQVQCVNIYFSPRIKLS